MKALPNWSSPNKTNFQTKTWYTAPSNGWVQYSQKIVSNKYGMFQIKDPNGNIVFYGIAGQTKNTAGFHTIFNFVPQGYSFYVDSDEIATYDSTTETYSITQGAFFIPAYT